MMKGKKKNCTKLSTRVDLSQWLRWLKRHVLRRRFVLRILYLLLRLVTGFDG